MELAASAAALLLLWGEAAPALAKPEKVVPPPETEYDRLKALAGDNIVSGDLLKRYKSVRSRPVEYNININN